MPDVQDRALTDQELLAVFKSPKADLSLLTPDEQQRLVTLTAPSQSSTGSMMDSLKALAAHPLNTAGDVATGVVKGAAHTAIDLGQLVHLIPGVSSGVDALYGSPGLSAKAFPSARESTAYSNGAQTAGGVLETLAELATPVTKAANAVPSAARAGRAFQTVMSAAKDVPLDVEAPGQVALRIQQLADRGASMPQAVRKLLLRITDPSKADLTYAEARDFASNISRLSANDMQRLSPVVAREVANLRVTLNAEVAKAAESAGKGAEYAAAMKEYAQAMKWREALSSMWDGAKQAIPYASGGGAAYYIAKKLKEAVSGP